MKILQLLPELNEGGVERGVVELNREYVKKGHQSIVISAGGKLAAQIELDGGRHLTFDTCSKNILTVPQRVKGLRDLVHTHQPDIVHARSRVPAWLAYLARRSVAFNFVTTIHGLNSINQYSRIMTRGNRVIAVGEAIKRHVVDGYSLDPQSITVIQRGVDMNKFDPATVDGAFIRDFKARYRLEGRVIATNVGRVTWLKDYETFIRAIALSKHLIPSITGLIVGGARHDKQDYFASLKTLAAELGVEKEIIFAGSQSKIAEIYFLSDMVVNTSVKMGNVARTIVESLAMNTPVITTTYEGLNNIVKNGVNGYLIKTRNENDLAEKLSILNTHPVLEVRSSLDEEYTLTTMVDKTLQIYRELMTTSA